MPSRPIHPSQNYLALKSRTAAKSPYRPRHHRLPLPAVSFIEGFRTPATVQAASLRDRPASETLNNRRLTQRSNYQLFARVRSVVNAQKESGSLSSRPKTGSGKTRDWKSIQEKPVEDTTARLSF